MKKFRKYIKSEKGISLLEIICSILIISIIIISMMGFFIQSAKMNQNSKEMVDSTYVAKTYMENIYYLSTISTFTEVKTDLNTRFTPINEGCSNECRYYESNEGYYVTIQINEPGSVIVKVYNDSSKNHQEAQMERLVSWKQ